ncbi:hypothetical protein BGW38_008631 [Lunasporangiospora selenospora]|uniref:Uncharacterized protein n=1 Tax=Lunasporangiospora selenospora TaxID=979761 RepID=A0A9P6G3T1_9FUNG|nr:hypothetical protein BGW38_008631 [Lunasporangiospora selenospora]
MSIPFETLQTALPLAYSAASALALVYLSRKPVHLDQYDALKDSVDEIEADSEPTNQPSGSGTDAVGESTTTELIQAQFQRQRAKVLYIHLARLGLTFLELGLAILTIFLVYSANNDDSNDNDPNGITDQHSLLNLLTQAVTWTYAAALTTALVLQPVAASQFWVRPQLDFLYILQVVLVSIQLFISDILTTPVSEWSLGIKLDLLVWLTGLGLLWTSLRTRSYEPWQPERKLLAGEIRRTPSAEYASSTYSQLTFAWVNPLVYLGFQRTLQDVDLPDLEVSDLSRRSIKSFKEFQRGNFTRSLLAALRWEFIIQILWAIPWSIAVNLSPFCLNRIIQYIECRECGPPTVYNYAWVFALLISSLLESIFLQAALHKGRRIYVHCTSICNAEVFAKSLRRKDIASADKPEEKTDEDSEDKEGSVNVSNLIAVDVRKLETPFSYLFYLYGYPVQFIIAGVQLYWLLGYAALVGIGFMIGSYPLPAKLYAMIMKLFKDIMNKKDERMDALNEMLSAIRIVKFFGWESKFEEKITAARNKELKRTKESFRQIILADVVWMIMPLLNIVVVLMAYTKLFNHDISASKMFTTLALFNIMRQALNILPWTIKSTMQAAVSLKRINKFLEEEELVKDTTITRLDGKAVSNGSSTPTVGFTNAAFIWPNKENAQVTKKAAKKESLFKRIKAKFTKTEPVATEPVAEPEAVQERFKLKNLNIEFPIGKLSLVVGPTGSGKSALLLALLGELERTEGDVYLPRLDYGDGLLSDRGSGIAYVAQTAWLQNTSVRNNILFGREFDQERYDAVVEGCALSTDFEILEAGDGTEVGEQGITLSGGQKQRVSLARAIYSDTRILLLDDCLSAVDTHTGKHLFQTLTGPLLQGRTIIMATHQVQLTLNSADLVVVLNKGEILGSGTPEEAVRNDWVENVNLAGPTSDIDSEVSTLDGDQRDKKAKKTDKPKVSVKLTEEEKKAEGSVSWRVYKTYLVASGGWTFWTGLIMLFLLRQVIDVGQNAWLAIWANKMTEAAGSFAIAAFKTVTPQPILESVYASFAPRDGSAYGAMTMALFGKGTPETVNVDFYLGVYISLCLLTVVVGTLTSYYSVLGGLRASQVLHEQLLHKVTRAKVRFFDTTPIGRIVNRFSSDIATIDEEMSNGLNGLFGSFVTVLGIIVIISVNMPVFMIPGTFIVIIYGFIGAVYVPVSRDLKRLNSNSRSPILNHFNEALTGLATIRAFGYEKRFLTKNLVNLDDNNRTFFLLWSTNRWLHWRVDIAGAFVAFTTGILILQSWGNIEPGWAALSLTYALMFTGTIVWVIRIYAQNEMNLNSVERVSEYMDLEEEPAGIIEGSRPPASWPHAGEIVIDHLTMRYAPDTPDVIKDVSFKINAGEKVGVVGRTGSGKSTFAISLFRFMDPVRGTITIDGIDICKIGLQDLRSNLTIIPQDPILFKGTLRSNLDPFGEREDRELWEALRRSHLIPDSRVSSVPASKRNSQEFTASSSSGAGSAESPACSVKGSTTGETETVDLSKITLDTPVKEHGSNFSQGQRQLIALARALVRQSKIIVMDEATASVDFETDQKIQTTIREEMSSATILTIAHRIRTIADFDRVLVMNAGEVAEFDKPLTLMKQEDSLFRSMCERSSEFDALLAIAEEKERKDAAGRL